MEKNRIVTEEDVKNAYDEIMSNKEAIEDTMFPVVGEMCHVTAPDGMKFSILWTQSLMDEFDKQMKESINV